MPDPARMADRAGEKQDVFPPEGDDDAGPSQDGG